MDFGDFVSNHQDRGQTEQICRFIPVYDDNKDQFLLGGVGCLVLELGNMAHHFHNTNEAG